MNRALDVSMSIAASLVRGFSGMRVSGQKFQWPMTWGNSAPGTRGNKM